MEQTITELVTIIGVVAALAVAYAKAFAVHQEAISQAMIDAFKVTSEYRRLLNLGVGIAIAAGMTCVGAVWLERWEIVPAGVLAGLLAAVEASKAHEANPETP